MAGIAFKGLRAYQQDLLTSEQSDLNEPNQLIDDFIVCAKENDRPVQEKSTLKHLVGTDLKHQMPPQMYAIVASLAKLVDTIESMDGEGGNNE